MRVMVRVRVSVMTRRKLRIRVRVRARTRVMMTAQLGSLLTCVTPERARKVWLAWSGRSTSSPS